MQWVYLHGKHASSLDTSPEIYYVPWITIVSMTPRSTLARSWQNASIFKVSFSAVLQLRFFFFQKYQPRFQSVKGDLSNFFCVKCFELFRYLHLQPKVASNQSCWQSLDSGAHRPTRHWSSQLRFVKRQISRSKMSRSKRVYLSISCFWQGLKGKKSVVSHPPHPKLTNVP